MFCQTTPASGLKAVECIQPGWQICLFALPFGICESSTVGEHQECLLIVRFPLDFPYHEDISCSSWPRKSSENSRFVRYGEVTAMQLILALYRIHALICLKVCFFALKAWFRQSVSCDPSKPCTHFLALTSALSLSFDVTWYRLFCALIFISFIIRFQRIYESLLLAAHFPNAV